MVKIVKCKAPFNALAINNSNSGMKISSCCVFPVKDNSKEFVTSDELKNSFKTKKFYKACECCTAYTSYDVLKDNNTLQDLHIRFGNNCNAVCIICRDKLEINNNKTTEETMKYALQVMKDNNETIELIQVLGGETLLYKNELFTLLDEIINMKNIKQVKLHTNGSIPDNNFYKKLGEYSKKINILLMFSIDGNEKTNHIFRINCHMNSIEKSIEMANQYRITYSIVHTISIFNILDLKENIDYYLNNLILNKGAKIFLNYVTNIACFSIMNLNNNLSKKAVNLLLEANEKVGCAFDGILLLAKQSEDRKDELKERINLFNKINNVNIEKSLHEDIYSFIYD